VKRYSVIYADPPWDYGKMKKRRKAARGGNPQAHYGTMTVEKICRLPVSEIADDNSALFLWVTNPKIVYGFEVMSAWGFSYKTTLTWVKVDKQGNVINNGMGFYFRGATEHILFGTRGRFTVDTVSRIPNVFMHQRGGHSKKPDDIRGKIVDVCGDVPRIELFARQKSVGWDVWGDEIDCDVDLSLI